MREKLLALLLAGTLTLGLAACAAGNGDVGQPSPSAEPEAPTKTLQTAPPTEVISLPPEMTEAPEESPGPSGTPEPAEVDSDLPRREYQPWQVGYMDFLTALAEADRDHLGDETAYAGLAVDQRGVYCMDAGEELGMTMVMSMGSEYYYLYDVDEDGVPELFVQYGDCEAAYTTQCYAYREGQIVCIGEFDMGHSGLYTHPGKSAVLRSEGHMGYKEVYEYPMEGGVLTEERVLFSEEDVQEYTPTEEIVPGARFIRRLYARRGEDDQSYWTGRAPYSAGKAMLLPICDWGVGRPATGNSTERARAAILAAMRGEGEVVGVSGDHFNGDVGPMPWEEYIQTVTAVPNAQVTAKIAAHFWQDMNGDGQQECVLRLESEMRRGDETWSGEDMVLLSEQDGTVYAYCFDFYDRDDFRADGTIQNYDGRLALSFWKDQCYEYMAGDEGSAQAVEWLDGSPLD